MARWLLKMLALEFLTEIIQDFYPRFKSWLKDYNIHWLFLFLILFILVVVTLYTTGCALLSNNISECRKACGIQMMASFEDGNCACKNAGL